MGGKDAIQLSYQCGEHVNVKKQPIIDECLLYLNELRNTLSDEANVGYYKNCKNADQRWDLYKDCFEYSIMVNGMIDYKKLGEDKAQYYRDLDNSVNGGGATADTAISCSKSRTRNTKGKPKEANVGDKNNGPTNYRNQGNDTATATTGPHSNINDSKDE